jgi:cardiolipin synthase
VTLANKITVLRIVAIPILVITLLQHYLLAARIIFVVSALSDAVDGAIARIRGERTPLGTFLDPLADKLLLVGSFVAFTTLGWIPVWVFIVILSRDMLIVLGWTVVYILTGNSKIQPRALGKATTAFQMALALALLINLPRPYYSWLLDSVIAVTILSGCDYVWIGNRRLGAVG